MHVTFTSDLVYNDNPLKFRKDNLSEIRKAILKLYHHIISVVPKLYQIVQDVKRVLVCLEEIVKAGGAVVPALVNKNSRHRALVGNGGRRYFRCSQSQIIDTLDDIGIFDDIQKVMKEYIEMEMKQYNCVINLKMTSQIQKNKIAFNVTILI
jgi:hypothetical protein